MHTVLRRVSLGAILLAPIAVSAADTLQPIVPQETCPLGYGAVFSIVQKIMSDSVIVAGMLAVILIAYAGFLFVTNPASPSNLDKGKKVLTDTLIGFVIVVAAWLIVNSIISVVTTGSVASFTQLLQPSDSSLCLPVAKPAAITPKPTVTPTSPVVVVPATGDEAAVRAQLAAAGINVNHVMCLVGSDGTGCTNVGGLQPTTIQQIINLKQACGSGCTVTVTGGSEPGHAVGTYSHGNGYKVDLGLGSMLDSYITQHMKYVGQRNGDGPGPAYTDSCNANSYNPSSSNQYVKESNHWDIRITSFCSLTS